MDLSKLSTEDLMALKGGDLSKVSTEGLLTLKGQQSGQLPPEVVNEPGLKPEIGFEGPMKTATQGMKGLGVAVAHGTEPLTPEQWQEAATVAKGGEPTTTAGKIGSMGGYALSPEGLALGKIGEPVIGTALEGAGAALGKLKSLINAPGTLKAAKAGIGEAMDKVTVDAAPVLDNMAKELGLTKVAKDGTIRVLPKTNFNVITNKINELASQGKPIPLQTGRDFLVAGNLKFKAGEGTSALSKAMAHVRESLNLQVPGRLGPATEMAKAAPQVEALKRLGGLATTVAKKGLKYAGYGAAGALGWKVLH